MRQRKILYGAIDSIDEFLRRKLRRDSLIWSSLKKIRNLHVVVHGIINRRRWLTNELFFERIVEAYSLETKCFFVIQVGACDGIVSDPIQNLVKKYHWHGIMIEPQKKEFERLKHNYREHEDRLQFENVAIAEKDGPMPLYRLHDEIVTEDWQRGQASLLPKKDLEQEGKITKEIVNCMTFETLLKRHRVQRIDLLQIDAEGYDRRLLESFDFGLLKPRLIRFEHRHLKLGDKVALEDFLKRYGYELLEMQYDTGAILQEKPCRGGHAQPRTS